MSITLSPSIELAAPGDDLPIQVSPPDRFYLLVCGGRDFTDQACVDQFLDRYLAAHPALRIVHGGARGADSCAADWAKRRKVLAKEFPAKWDQGDGTTDRSAGTKRNRKMAEFLVKMLNDGHQAHVLAFPGGRGTQHMKEYAKKRGISVGQIGIR